MKITKSQLKQIIKEELENVLNEGWLDRMNPFKKEPWPPRAPKASHMLLNPSGGGEHSWTTKDDPRLNQQSFDTDGDGDVDKLDPEAVRRALQADTQWTVEKTMEEFGDEPPMADEEEFKAVLKARLASKNPKSEQEAEDVFEDVYESFQQRSPNY
tara:strand:- start:762 stop:1229 length:468 start_codon:yes stop_codon:yes gene_type:complete